MSYASTPFFPFDDASNLQQTNADVNTEESNLKLCMLSCIATKNKTSKMYNAFKHDEHSKIEREKTIKNALKSILKMSDIADYTESTLYKRMNVVGNTRKWMNSKPTVYTDKMNDDDINSIYDVPKETNIYGNKLKRQQFIIKLNGLKNQLDIEDNDNDELNDVHAALIVTQKDQHDLNKKLRALQTKHAKPGFFYNKELGRGQITELKESVEEQNEMVNRYQRKLTDAQIKSDNKKNELLKQIKETQQRIDDIDIPKSKRSNSWWGGKTMRNKRRKHKKTRR
jgi:hypothetical protein